MGTLFLVRGLPGSGKSTLAKEIADVVFEADMFFYTTPYTYQYDASKIKDAHDWCHKQTTKALQANIPKVAVANTFVKRWEMDFYRALASFYNYKVIEVTMSGQLYPNVHGVPNETIERMRQGWER